VSEIYMQEEGEAKVAGVNAMDAFLNGTPNGSCVIKSVINAPDEVKEGALK